jgi:hypothetical protein
VTAKAAGPAGRAVECGGGHRGTRSMRRQGRPDAARDAPALQVGDGPITGNPPTTIFPFLRWFCKYTRRWGTEG